MSVFLFDCSGLCYTLGATRRGSWTPRDASREVFYELGSPMKLIKLIHLI